MGLLNEEVSNNINEITETEKDVYEVYVFKIWLSSD